MAEYINQALTEDSYADPLTLGPDFRTDHVTVTVDRNNVLFQLALGHPGDWRWTDEREFHSIQQSFRVGNIVGIRFRSANAGAAAVIDASLCGPSDPDFAAGTPLQPGAVSSVIPRVTALPGSPADGEQVILDLNPSFPGVEWFCVYNVATGYWDVLGGPPLIDKPAGNIPAANVWAATGSGITLPHAGDYRLKFAARCTANQGGAVNASIGFETGATVPVGLEMTASPLAAGSIASLNVEDLFTGLAANEAVRGAVFAGVTAAQFDQEYLTATPLRIQ